MLHYCLWHELLGHMGHKIFHSKRIIIMIKMIENANNINSVWNGKSLTKCLKLHTFFSRSMSNSHIDIICPSQIKILNYAYLTDPASFPSVKYLPAGSQNVQFKCGASFARSTTFFINGSKLRDGGKCIYCNCSLLAVKITYSIPSFHFIFSILYFLGWFVNEL